MRLSVDALQRCEAHFTCLNECVGQINAFARREFGKAEKKTLRSETLRVLFQYQVDRSLGTYCLLINGLIWDAEIVLRTVYEAFSKILLIGLGQGDEADALVDEFWGELGAIYDRKASIKAAQAQKLVRRFSSDDNRVFSLLQDSRLFHTEARGTKKIRKDIESRWSFAGIVQTVDSGALGNFVGMDALLHQYGIASHLIHASPKAFDLLEDRATRGEDRLLLEISHAGRIASDIVSFLALGAHFATENGRSRQFAPELKEAFDRMGTAVAADRKAFHASQDDFYREWGHE